MAPAALPAQELLRGLRELVVAAMDYYIPTVQGGILPAAYMSEAAFTWFYDKLVRRAHDPSALTFVLGFDSLPIQADKSLYDLAQWCRARPPLAELLAHSASDQIAARLVAPGALAELARPGGSRADPPWVFGDVRGPTVGGTRRDASV